MTMLPPAPPPAQPPRRRLRLDVTGAVQGVGFRPFVHRLAVSEGLGGFVCNTGAGVSVEIEGPAPALDRFLMRLETELVPPAALRDRQVRPLPVQGADGFVIAPSTATGRRSALVLPDLATCPDCLREIFDPTDRRYRYPFTTCVHCGPRYSIIGAVPYDRARTTMRHFPMCPACQADYDDPASRRFHAETNACPVCGPQLALWDVAGNALAGGDQALAGAAEAIRLGRIVALKGLGGFQLLVDARNEAAVRRLRARKRRPSKPFAIMVPGLEAARALAEIPDEAADLLGSPAAPIVLVRARDGGVAPAVAPGNPDLGIMVPYTPLHHLLMDALGFAIVATSGNRSGAPIVADEAQALAELAGIADLFLVHDRPVHQPVDDSVVRLIGGRPTVLRNARGYAPLVLGGPAPAEPVLALGGHQKAALARADGDGIVLGPHIADLDTEGSRGAYGRAIAGMAELWGAWPALVACDRHPDYHSTRIAPALEAEVRSVPHHLAHVLACLVDNGLDPDTPALGVAWDGTGFGGDGTVWGGEFLAVGGGRWRRIAHLLPFRLPGGEAAAREPRRSALGALHAAFGDEVFAMTGLAPLTAFGAAERRVLAAMLGRGINAPPTSSAGRLFDAVAAIVGLCQRASFEGEAAMALEAAAARATAPVPLGLPVLSAGAEPWTVDWRPWLTALASGRARGVAAADLAAGFHDALAAAVVAVAARAGIGRVLLTGGCFQNAMLIERAAVRLRAAGFQPLWHHRVPPNDGGLAVGQAAFAARPLIAETV